MRALAALFCLLLTVLTVPAAFAERSDRNKPVTLEADRITIDDAHKVHIFEGHVRLQQGTLLIRANKLVVTQDAQGFEKGVATGGKDGLAYFREKLDGKNQYVEGQAERIVYDGETNTTQFFLRAHVKSGRDEVSGQYISYDGETDKYVVTSGPGGTVAPSVPGQDHRVRAIIQPKPQTAKPAPNRK